MRDNININSKGNVAFGKDNATVNQINVDHTPNKKLNIEINNLKNELAKIKINKDNREAIDTQLENLENYVKIDKKNSVLMLSTLESIKNIAQGAIGSAIGAGLVEAFKRVGILLI